MLVQHGAQHCAVRDGLAAGGFDAPRSEEDRAPRLGGGRTAFALRQAPGPRPARPTPRARRCERSARRRSVAGCQPAVVADGPPHVRPNDGRRRADRPRRCTRCDRRPAWAPRSTSAAMPGAQRTKGVSVSWTRCEPHRGVCRDEGASRKSSMTGSTGSPPSGSTIQRTSRFLRCSQMRPFSSSVAVFGSERPPASRIGRRVAQPMPPMSKLATTSPGGSVSMKRPVAISVASIVLDGERVRGAEARGAVEPERDPGQERGQGDGGDDPRSAARPGLHERAHHDHRAGGDACNIQEWNERLVAPAVPGGGQHEHVRDGVERGPTRRAGERRRSSRAGGGSRRSPRAPPSAMPPPRRC